MPKGVKSRNRSRKEQEFKGKINEMMKEIQKTREETRARSRRLLAIAVIVNTIMVLIFIGLIFLIRSNT